MKIIKFPFIVFLFLYSFPLSSAQLEQKPPVTLAKSWDGKKDVTGWWMSEKLDGVRGYWTGKKLISRSGKEFYPPTWFIQSLPPKALDGELWIDRNQFQKVLSIVRKKSPHNGWRNVKYIIFDAPGVKKVFEQRLEFISSWLRKKPNSHIQLLKQEIVRNNPHLTQKLKEIEKLGGEGLMLRKPNSYYLKGRTTELLKVKTFHDAEAKVIRHKQGKGKFKNMLGSILVELPNGIQFFIGSGFSNKERKSPPPLGSTITFKYQGLTKIGKPRFASFLRIRKAL